MGLMGLAGKNMQEENRSLLQRSKAFGELEKNKFINAPDLRFQISKHGISRLETIKKERAIQDKKQKALVNLLVGLLLILTVLMAWFIV
ncbi:MAG: hypothetical protein AAFQ94_30340 [Bacteroidota bacterium]